MAWGPSESGGGGAPGAAKKGLRAKSPRQCRALGRPSTGGAKSGAQAARSGHGVCCPLRGGRALRLQKTGGEESDERPGMSEEAGREAGKSKEEPPRDGENAPRALLEEVESGPGGGLVRALRATGSAVAALMAAGRARERLTDNLR
ncbi:uncharacterized protein [Kogia breviceps]|uniref:uncharacterized protein isoform X3 n=1 Tax=Kogia breviceps TaxID=27615 RepID=UPI0034D2BBC1